MTFCPQIKIHFPFIILNIVLISVISTFFFPDIHSEFNGVPLESQPQLPSVQTELIMLSLPAIAGQAIEPLAQLMETAYIGRLGKLLGFNSSLIHPKIIKELPPTYLFLALLF